MTIGNMILVRLTDRLAVASDSSGAMNFTRRGAKISPKAVIASVMRRMRLIYEDKKETACFLPFFTEIEL